MDASPRCSLVLRYEFTIAHIAFSSEGVLLTSGIINVADSVFCDGEKNVCISAPPNSSLVQSFSVCAGKVFFASKFVNGITVFDVTNKCVRKTLIGHDDYIRCISWSANGHLLASGSVDRTVRIWDLNSETPLKHILDHGYGVTSIAWSPNGDFLASATFDNTVQVWHVDCRVQRSSILHGHYANSLAWSPDGRQLVSGGGDGTILLWTIDENGRGNPDPVVFQGHTKRVSDVAWLPDGKQFVSCGTDDTVRVWSASSGRQVRKMMAYSDAYAFQIAPHPNGKQIAMACTTTDALIFTVCEWSDRTNHLFAGDLRRLIFQTMCLKHRLENNSCFCSHPRLQMAVWLEIFQVLACVLCASFSIN